MKLGLLIIGLLIIPSILAIQSKDTCLNSTHLETRIEWTQCGSTCEDKNITQVINCTYGCDTVDDECKEPEYMINLYIIGIIVGFIILMVVVLRR